MGYFEIKCQLCGVSFAIGRIRTSNEPFSAAWSYTGTGFVDDDDEPPVCIDDKTETGCQNVERDGMFGNDENVGIEHIAGAGCTRGSGYNGNMISLQEMKGCRAIQCLMKKEAGWQPEADDEDFELESEYFLSGIGDGSPDESSLSDLSAVRHGVVDILVSNLPEFVNDGFCVMPFHPTCLSIFKRISKDRYGKVDISGLATWHIEMEDHMHDSFPREYAVTHASEQWWQHELGNEYLVANPVVVPGLSHLLATWHRDFSYVDNEKVPYDVDQGVYSWQYIAAGDSYAFHHDTPPPTEAMVPNCFQKLPSELLYMILDDLSSKDIANLRLVTRACRQLPVILFRERLLEDMPWLWEARDLRKDQTDWYNLYQRVKGCWQEIKGLKNRKRIWKDVNEICNRIDKGRRDGIIVDQ